MFDILSRICWRAWCMWKLWVKSNLYHTQGNIEIAVYNASKKMLLKTLRTKSLPSHFFLSNVEAVGRGLSPPDRHPMSPLPHDDLWSASSKTRWSRRSERSVSWSKSEQIAVFSVFIKNGHNLKLTTKHKEHRRLFRLLVIWKLGPRSLEVGRNRTPKNYEHLCCK